TPLVGRDEELAQLEASFQRLSGNRAQVVAVVGEAGLGKSRLLYEFRRRLDCECVTFFEGRCSSLGQAVPYFPFITMLKLYFGLVPGDSVDAACTKVTAKLGEWSAEKAEREYPALSRLLGLRSPSAGGPVPGDLERLLVTRAEGSPFCVEEMTRSLIEEGYLVANGGARKLTRPVDEIRIPGTVQEVIAARLDRLGSPAKRVVQVAAVL